MTRRFTSVRLALVSLLSASAVGCAGDRDTSAPVRETVIAPAEAPAPADGRPGVSIDALLERTPTTLTGLRWHDDERLEADITLAGDSASAVRLIGLDGSLSEPLELSAGTPSPDGSWRLVRGDQGWEIVDVRSGESVPVRPADDPREFRDYKPPVWSRDSRYVAFAQMLNTTGPVDRTVREVDGVSIVEVGLESDSELARVARITLIEAAHPDRPRYTLLDELVYDVAWDADNTLYATRIAFGARDPYTEILAFTPEDDGSRVVYSTRGRFQRMVPHVSPSGGTFATTFDIDNRNWDDFQSLVLIDGATGELTRLTDDMPVTGGTTGLAWSGDGREIYSLVRAGGLVQLWAIPVEGQPRQLTSAPRNHTNLQISPDRRRLAYQTEDGYGRRDVRVFDIETGQESVVFVIDEPAQDFALGAWQQVRWESTDGVRPYGWLFHPPDFDPDRRYPMIVDVHGGGPGSALYLRAPLTNVTVGGPLEWHAWAQLGYVVFVPDYRSAGDYGPDVIAARLAAGRHSPLDDMVDAVTGVRHMLEQGYVDPDRVAMFGHSAGAPRVYNAVVSNPELFAALIINEGIAPDPLSTSIRLLSGQSAGGRSMGVLEESFQAELADAPERYTVNTMFSATQIDAPTLIMMGNEELGGTGLWAWEVVFSILRSRGVPARMFMFTEEGHVHLTPASSRFAFEQMRIWLETHLGP